MVRVGRLLGIDRKGKWTTAERYWRRITLVILPLFGVFALLGLVGGILSRDPLLPAVSVGLLFVGYALWRFSRRFKGKWTRLVALEEEAVIGAIEDVLRKEAVGYRRLSESSSLRRLPRGVSEVFHLEDAGTITVRVGNVGRGARRVRIGHVTLETASPTEDLMADLDRAFDKRLGR